MKFNNYFGLGCLSLLCTWAFFLLSKSLILFLFWDWFIIPIFPGIPELSFIKSMALMTFIDVIFKDGFKINLEENNNSALGYFLSIVLTLITVLSIGFIIHLIL